MFDLEISIKIKRHILHWPDQMHKQVHPFIPVDDIIGSLNKRLCDTHNYF